MNAGNLEILHPESAANTVSRLGRGTTRSLKVTVQSKRRVFFATVVSRIGEDDSQRRLDNLPPIFVYHIHITPERAGPQPLPLKAYVRATNAFTVHHNHIRSNPSRIALQLFSSLDFLRRPIRHLGNFFRLAADLAPTILPLHPACDADVLVPEEVPEHEHPAVVARQRGVELVRDLP